MCVEWLTFREQTLLSVFRWAQLALVSSFQWKIQSLPLFYSYFIACALNHFIPVGFTDLVCLFFCKFSRLSVNRFQLIRNFVLGIKD
jgi:hypothetical protein